MPKVELRGVGKTYHTSRGSVEALKGVDLSIDEGRFVSIIGPSGCGKSTLIRILAGLTGSYTGEVRVESGGNSRPDNAVVFQEYAIFPWRSVLENVTFGLEMAGVPRDERLRIATEYIHKVGLTPFTDHYPHQLSGGMKQRVGLARALAMDPEMLLMDEPFGSLDAQTRTILQGELLRIWEEDRKTVVYVTHSIEEAVLLGDRVDLMSARPGMIKSSYPVNLPHPRDIRMRTSTDFTRLVQTIWDDLVGEVDRSREEQR